MICNSNFGSSGANKINLFSDAHAFTYLTLYKQSKEETHIKNNLIILIIKKNTCQCNVLK